MVYDSAGQFSLAAELGTQPFLLYCDVPGSHCLSKGSDKVKNNEVQEYLFFLPQCHARGPFFLHLPQSPKIQVYMID